MVTVTVQNPHQETRVGQRAQKVKAETALRLEQLRRPQAAERCLSLSPTHTQGPASHQSPRAPLCLLSHSGQGLQNSLPSSAPAGTVWAEKEGEGARALYSLKGTRN